MKNDAAARIAEKIRAWWVGKGCVEPSAKLGEFSERAIRRAINAAVARERRRCLSAVDTEAIESMTEQRFVNPGNIITDIIGGINAKRKATK